MLKKLQDNLERIDQEIIDAAMNADLDQVSRKASRKKALLDLLEKRNAAEEAHKAGKFDPDNADLDQVSRKASRKKALLDLLEKRNAAEEAHKAGKFDPDKESYEARKLHADELYQVARNA
jgi:beta-glucosidase-like glycosyl hydrolase